jgi:hypothetical protein
MPEQFKLPLGDQEPAATTPLTPSVTQEDPAPADTPTTEQLSVEERLGLLPQEQLRYLAMWNALPPKKQGEIRQFYTQLSALQKAIRGAHDTLVKEERYGITHQSTPPPPPNNNLTPKQRNIPGGIDQKSRAAGDDSMEDT